LQQHLDGLTRVAGDGVDPAECTAHARACPACAERLAAARLLTEGLRILVLPAPPAGLALRISASLAAEARARRRRHWRRRAGLAVAAAAAGLLVLLSRPWWHGASPGPQTQGLLARSDDTRASPGEQRERPAPVRESVAQAGSAALALTSRTADATVGPTAFLWPLMSARSPVQTPLGLGGGHDPALEEPLETPARPFKEAGAELSAGLEPVAQSARRAVGLFLRDLASPMGATSADKPS
jgi:hypothetical protein